MEAFVTAGAGFLLAVLWFDLMHDVLARGHTGDLPEPALATIAGYYARVTTAAHPMGRLVAVAMVGTLAGIVAELVSDFGPTWLAWASLVLAAGPIGLAGRRTFPNAVRLGTRADDVATQSRLARTILGDHLFCLACIATVIALQLGAAAA